METRTLRVLQMVYLLMVIYAVWSVIPDHQRRYLRLALLRRVQEVSWRAARETARPAMTAELAGWGEQYGLPLSLSLLAEKARSSYDRMVRQ